MTSRFPSSFEPNALTQALRRARTAGRPLLDLTLTNPTRAGFHYDPQLLLPLASAAALTYEPLALGIPAAREAVSSDYRRRGLDIPAERIVLTASTSEAYAWLFKLCCRPTDDEVLIPAPSYPLFDHLTRMEGVRAVPYRLDYHGRWALDVSALDEAWSDEVRAVLVVSPNNPTGSIIGAGDLQAIGERCAERHALLIVDEVFADYPLRDDADTAMAMPSSCVSVRLGGLSKSAGLPQVKLGWMAFEGEEAQVANALEKLELIADTYLSVSTPVQVAAPALIASGEQVRSQIRERVRRNHAALRAAAARHTAVDVLPADAGWSVVLRVPAVRSEEELVMDLLERDQVLVHPGYFFDFDHGCHLIVSLLTPPETFAAGVTRLLERVDG
ncbi:MAG: pyridoxal phosphate-dependent aminotransferase [Vicinamibacterales bacterium]